MWTQGIPGAIVSIIAAIFSIIFFLKNSSLSKTIADRTLNLEAQKLLLEINKQYITCPELFAIYDDDPKNKAKLQADPVLKTKVEALGYMKLNVFEIVYSELPNGAAGDAWREFFLDSLDRCSVLSEELRTSEAIYQPKLIKAYKLWLDDSEGKARRLAQRAQYDGRMKSG